jgi:hypothetical protein
VEEDEAAVDERPEVDRPAHPHFVLLHVVARGQPHQRGVVLARHRKETVRAREVDDLAVVGRRLPRHPRGSIRSTGSAQSQLALRAAGDKHSPHVQDDKNRGTPYGFAFSGQGSLKSACTRR